MKYYVRKKKKTILKSICLLTLVGIFFIVPFLPSYAIDTFQDIDGIRQLDVGNQFTVTYDDGSGQLAGTLRILITLTLISLAPFLLITMTSFVRIVIVLHFTRAALNTQSAPPNQVLMTLALFLTFFIMQPVITQVNEQAIIPFEAGVIDQNEALLRAMEPIREFMYTHTMVKDVSLFMTISNLEWDGTRDPVPTSALIPSFIISELRTAFMIGFIIYIPFIVIDMVIASTLMAMGMMMLPPTVISMPFKILLFVMADGWHLIVGSLVKTFY
ncbi:MAG: flagellar type III secretion system pore protein FliP [Lachnospiraceae bacterium]|nr:flagellar type III secretion system pore protein FliP [Lachnospiraceae bacterium]